MCDKRQHAVAYYVRGGCLRLYNIFNGNDLKVAEKIQQRRLQMLIHSCIYYELDGNIISDQDWDSWAKELLKLQTDYPEISKQVMWYEAFKDWDATSGAFLPLKDPWVIKKAQKLLKKPVQKQSKITSKPKKMGMLF